MDIELMNKVIQAIDIEKQYHTILPDKKQKNDFDLHGKIKALGFDSLDHYFLMKKQYILTVESQKFIHERIDPPSAFFSRAVELVQEEKSALLHIFNKVPCVYIGADSEYNSAYCEANNIQVNNMHYNGGAIVATEHDMSIAIVIPINDVMQMIQEKVSSALTKIGVENSIDGNDIICQGHKISGCAEFRIGNYSAYVFQISFKVDMDLINNICTKEMVKVPKGITDIYPNITRDDFISEVY